MSPGRVRVQYRHIARTARRSTASTAGGLVPRTPKQLRIARFLREYEEQNGFPPTLGEIGDLLGVNKTTVFEHLERMETSGLIVRVGWKRGYRLADGVRLPAGGPTRVELLDLLAACLRRIACRCPDAELTSRLRRALAETNGDGVVAGGPRRLKDAARPVSSSGSRS